MRRSVKREFMPGDDEMTPMAACVVAWSRRGRYWAITVTHCPFCGKQHWHGAGGDPEGEPALGHRVAHCLCGSGYELVETAASRVQRMP